MAITPGCLRERGIQWTNGWQDAAESIMPYIILLDNFMGPLLEKRGTEKKKVAELKALHFNSDQPPSPPLLSTLWSATVRAILCWFTGWEDGNCCWSVIQDRGKGTGVAEGKRVGGLMSITFGSAAYFLEWLVRCARYENRKLGTVKSVHGHNWTNVDFTDKRSAPEDQDQVLTAAGGRFLTRCAGNAHVKQGSLMMV